MTDAKPSALSPAFFKTVRPYLVDTIVLFVLATAAGIASYSGANQIGANVLDMQRFGDTWFDSDVAAYFEWLKHRFSSLHVRTYKHPLFSLILCLPIYGLKALGINLIVATRLYIAAIAAVWLGALYVLLRLLGCRRFDATLFALLGATSAAAMFWFVVPESYPFGSLGFIFAAILTLLAQSQTLPFRSYVAVNIFTIGITVTNWMAGILTAAIGNSRQKALKIWGLTLSIVIVLAGVQKFIFPRAAFPPFIPKTREASYLFSSESGGIVKIVKSLFAHTIVMPQIQILPHPRTDAPIMLTQFSRPGSGSLWGAVAVGLWLALLGLGLWALFTLKIHRPFRVFLGLLLLGQLLLHLVYTGRETFLYSLHFLPLFISVAALSTLNSRSRLWGVGIAGLLFVCLVVNNIQQFDRARAFYRNSHPETLPILNEAAPGEGKLNFDAELAFRRETHALPAPR